MARTSTIPLRTQQILNYLMDARASNSDISIALDIPYNQVCRVITILKNMDKIEAVDTSATSAIIWSAKSHDPMPKITNFGHTNSAIDYAVAMRDRARINNGRFDSAPVNEAVNAIAMALTSLMHQTVLMANHNDINERELDNVQRSLISAEQRFIGMAQFCRQILDEPNFNNREGFRAISFSPQWNQELIKSSYDALWSKPDAFNKSA